MEKKGPRGVEVLNLQLRWKLLPLLLFRRNWKCKIVNRRQSLHGARQWTKTYCSRSTEWLKWPITVMTCTKWTQFCCCSLLFFFLFIFLVCAKRRLFSFKTTIIRIYYRFKIFNTLCFSITTKNKALNMFQPMHRLIKIPIYLLKQLGSVNCCVIFEKNPYICYLKHSILKTYNLILSY